MSFFANLFGKRQPANVLSAPDAYRAFADTLPDAGLSQCLLHWAAITLEDTIDSLRLQGLSDEAVPAPDCIEAALGSAVVMVAEEFVVPALHAEAAKDISRPRSDSFDAPGVLLGMLVAFNLACQVKTDVPSLEAPDVITASFQAFSLNLDADEQALMAPVVLDAFQRVFSGDEPTQGDVAQQVFEYVVLVISYLLGDDRVSAGALSFEAAAMLPDVRLVVA
jgi:hypothetical protein